MDSEGKSGVRYVEYRGFYFMLVSDSEFDGTPFCPTCLTKMSFMSYAAPYLCLKCRAVTPFTIAQLHGVHREVEDRLRQAELTVHPVFQLMNPSENQPRP